MGEGDKMYISKEVKKRIIAALAIIIFVLLFLLIAPGKKGDTSSLENFSFVREQNPRYLGSYTLKRCNPAAAAGASYGCWIETGEWSSHFELLTDLNRRVGLSYTTFGEGTFRASPGYSWVLRGDFLQLEKTNKD